MRNAQHIAGLDGDHGISLSSFVFQLTTNGAKIMATKKQVALAWYNGTKAKTGKNSRGDITFHTDGEKLWSYDLLIGYTEEGKKIVLDYTSPDNFQSMTTSNHVGCARRWAHEVVSP